MTKIRIKIAFTELKSCSVRDLKSKNFFSATRLFCRRIFDYEIPIDDNNVVPIAYQINQGEELVKDLWFHIRFPNDAEQLRFPNYLPICLLREKLDDSCKWVSEYDNGITLEVIGEQFGVYKKLGDFKDILLHRIIV